MDMHLKNWAFLSDESGCRELSPAYDLICSRLFIQDKDSALALNGKRSDLNRHDFEALAQTLKLDSRATQHSIARLLHLSTTWELLSKRSHMTDSHKENMIALIRERAARLT